MDLMEPFYNLTGKLPQGKTPGAYANNYGVEWEKSAILLLCTRPTMCNTIT